MQEEDSRQVEDSPSQDTTKASLAKATKTETLADGREVQIFSDIDGARAAILAETASEARAAIAEKGAFSLAVSGGDIATALVGLAEQPGLDFSKFHVFFSHDVIGKLGVFKEACQLWLDACRVPKAQVHAVADLAPEGAAAQYTATICMQDEEVVADSSEGLPAMDLTLLEVGDDGTCGGIHPESPELAEAGSGKVVLFREEACGLSPGAVAVSTDFMSASKRTLLLAGGAGQADTVQLALSSNGSTIPAGLVRAPRTTWLLTVASAADYTSSSKS